MFQSQKLKFTFVILLAAGFILAACQRSDAPSGETIVETVVVTEVVAGETVEVVVTATPAPVEEAPPEPRTLVICIGQEPDSLYYLGTHMLAANQVFQAIYDGPYDKASFDYQAVILEKMPKLADGDTVFQAVEVVAGDTIVDDSGTPVVLEAGVVYRPSGCTNSDCAVTYADGDGLVTLDQMVVTFKLLPGLLWSDRTPLTAADSVYSFELQKDPDTPVSKYTINRTTSYEALDDVTTQWTGLPGYVDSLYFTNFYRPFPRHVWSAYTAAELLEAPEARETPLGWGPYVIEEWVAGESIRLSKNENYFRADEGLPKFDHAVFRIVEDNANANIARILSGECDIVDQNTHLENENELMLELQSRGLLTATSVTGTVFEHADFGILPACFDDGGWDTCISRGRPDFFGDVRVRRAITHCMDRQAVVDTVMLGQSIVLNTYLPPQHPLFNADAASYEFNVETGSTLLEEAGWVLGDDGVRIYAGSDPNIPQGTRLSFNFLTNNATQRKQSIQILADSMAQCGIEAVPEYWNSSEYFAAGPDGPIFGRRFEIGQFAWLTGVEPPCELYLSELIPTAENLWVGQNTVGFQNEDFDAACNKARQSLPGQPSYDEGHLEAQAIWAEQVPSVPLYLWVKLAGTRPDMCNFIIDPTEESEMFNIEEFDYGESCSG